MATEDLQREPPGGAATGASTDHTPNPADDIGQRLAAHRTRRGVKVSALAREVGVSPSLISQIERGLSRPSVSTLFALAEALDVPMDAFFRDCDADGVADRASATPAADAPLRLVDGDEPDPRDGRYVVRVGERPSIDIEGGVRWERLTPARLEELEFMELVYAPGAESHAALYRHPGMEMVLVLSGSLTIFVGFERYELEQGDSICFPSTIPHRYVNPTQDTTRAVTVIVPDGAMHGPPTNQRRP